MKTGDIVIVSFPFTDLINQKARPAVVVAETEDKYKDVIVFMISSIVPPGISKYQILLEPSTENNLRTSSLLRVDRIVTVEQNKVLAKIGKIDKEYFQKFQAVFKSLIDS